MANPNSEIWGAPETWIYSPNTTLGLTSELSQTLNADRPKVAYFGAGTTAGYEGSLLRAINVSQKMALNEFIDNTICPCGQSPDVSPFAKIAIFNENDDLSTTPRVVTINDNINWFFADKAVTSPYNNGFEYFKQYTRQGVTNEGLKYQQFAPKANSPASGANVDMQMCPYTYYGLRSLFLSIEVHCMPKTATNPILNTNWRTLKAWQLNYSNTEDIIGLRLYVRTCQSINANTHELTYSTDKAISGGQQSFVCVTNPITINNDDADTPTQMLSIYNKGQRCAYIFDITGEISAWDSGNDSRTNRAVLPCWDYFDGQTVHTYYGIPSDPVRYYYYKIPYSEDTYNKIMSIAALFGCFFTDRNVNVFPYDMLTEYAYLPIVDENGVAHGEYTNGMANATNPLYTKNSIRDIDYNPNLPPVPIDPNTYSNSSYFKFVALGSVGNKRYSLGVTDVNGLLSDLWSLLTTFSQDSFDYFTQKVQAGFLVTNPIDSIVSLLCFPFTIPHNYDNVPIKLGKYDMTARGNTVSQSTYTINFTGVPIFPRFGNCYLDYEPYTNYEVYIPFCGTVPLKAADIIGHTLNVKLIVDLYTGSCTGYILADDLVIETVTGTVAITIPITGMDSSTINAQIVNANLNYKSSQYLAGAAIGSMVSVSGFIGALSNPAETVNKIAQSQITEERAQYELTHIPTQPHIIGASSPALGWCCDTIARVMIYYPTGDVITDNKPPSLIDDKIQSFGDLNGFSCLKWGKVREFSGFTLGNIKLDGVPCTESERARLKQLFSTGVYL